MFKAKLLFVFVVMLMLSACGDTDTETSGTEVSGQNGILTVTLLNSIESNANVVNIGDSATIQVQLVDSNNSPITSQLISFSTDKGTASAESRLTNSSGETSFSITTTGVSAGIVTATIAATIDGETLSTELLFEVVDDTVVVEEGVSISLVIVSAEGIVTNRIKTESSAQFRATLLDQSGDPIADTPVSFTSELGSLQSSSALTNSEGIASVNLDSGIELGAGYAAATVTVGSVQETASLAFEVIAGLDVDDINLGYFDETDTFVTDLIKTNQLNEDATSTINAGATLGLEFSIVDAEFNPIRDTITASFTSSCVARGKATLDAAVESVNGVIRATYKDLSCAGTSGNEDTITATISVNSTTYYISHELNILPEGLGSVEFVSATPDSIVIKGTGGQGKQEVSTLTFLVKGELGNPIDHQEVQFQLTSTVGGVQLVESSGITGSDGLVSAIVKSGTVPTSVRVNAIVTTSEGEVISSQSDLLSINTGLPDQDSITLALSQINPEAFDIHGQQVVVTAFMADSFNNPVPDGTTINFTTEGGAIESFCHTSNGSCSVNWTSQEPRLSDHRATILAYAIGHEFFVDVNGNNVMDTEDGSVANSNITNMDAVDAGFERPDAVISSGFFDLQEAWRDDNENTLYDSGELFIDFNNSGDHDTGDGFFNGPQCSSDTLCPEQENDLVTIRKSTVLITSGSHAYVTFTQSSDSALLLQNYGEPAVTAASNIPRGGTSSFVMTASDQAMQTLPFGTQISITTTDGELSGSTGFVVPNQIGTNDPNGYGGKTMAFNLLNNVEETTNATVTVTISFPSGVVTEEWFNVTLD